jgi:hypothetical protein
MLALLTQQEETPVRLLIIGGCSECREVAAQRLNSSGAAQHNVRLRLGERGGECQSIWALAALACSGE